MVAWPVCLMSYPTTRLASCAPSLTDSPLRADAGHADKWVQQELWNRHRLDAEQILVGLPTGEYDYRPVRLGYRGKPVPLPVRSR